MTAQSAITSALVTGAGGFLGSHIVGLFASQNCRVSGVDRETDIGSADFSALLRGEQPQVLVHAAGGASVPFSMQHPRQDFRNGPNLLSSLLEQVRNFSPGTRVIFLSSAAVYGNPDRLPIAESAPANPISAYGFHKHMAEMLCREYGLLYGVQVAIARIFSAYGEGLRKQVLWDLCQRLSAHPQTLSLHGSGSESRDFLHARDVARGIFAIASGSRFEADIYNLASGEETSIRDLATLLVTALGEKSAVTFDGIVSQGDPRNWRADISKIRALGFAPEVSLASGIQSYADWHRNQHS